MNEGRQGVYIDPFTPEFSGTTDYHLRSDYDARNVAIFGQLDGSFDARWGWSFGLRGEIARRTTGTAARATASRAPPTSTRRTR